MKLLFVKRGSLNEHQRNDLAQLGYYALETPDGPADVGTESPSLRDYFAAAALTGLLATSGNPSAANAYEWADAMLRARDKKPA